MNDLEEWLEKKYWEEGLSQSEIAKLINSSQSSVQRWMKKFNIKARKPSLGWVGRIHSKKTKQKMRGARLKNNPGAFKKGEIGNWKGGKRTYYGSIARAVWEEYWREKVPDGYCIHHVDRNIKNNDICNLALLTPSFHMKLHRRTR